MIPSQLKSRTKFIKATPEKKRAIVKNFSRKETANINIEEERHYSESFDTFFEYEKELSSMKPSGQQYEEVVANKNNSEKVGFVVMQDKDYFSSDDSVSSAITMEDSECKKSFEFKQCLHFIEEDRQCKRQAPKSSKYCSAHKGRY